MLIHYLKLFNKMGTYKREEFWCKFSDWFCVMNRRNNLQTLALETLKKINELHCLISRSVDDFGYLEMLNKLGTYFF